MSRSTKKNFVGLWFWAFGAMIVGATSVAAHAQCAQYAVDIIPGPPCQVLPPGASGQAINEAGELIGAYHDCDLSGFAALWLGEGSWQTIPVPAEFIGLAGSDINRDRQIAGTVAVPNTSTYERAAFIDFDARTVLNLGIPAGGNFSIGHAINNNSIVCGVWGNNQTGDPALHGFVWRNGIMTDLQLPRGPNHVANDVSETNRVCGWMGDASHSDAHAFILDLESGDVIDVGAPLPKSTNAVATAINDHHAICGQSIDWCGKLCLTRRGFFWQNGKVQDLGILPGYDETHPSDLNDSNTVIGACTYSDIGGSAAFIWQDGVMTALNDLIDPALGLNIDSARAINNAGQIAGSARVIGSSETVAVRLTPVPKVMGDYNCDRVVDMADILGVVEHWEYDTPNADFNKDGIVNVPDLLIVIQNWTR